MGELDELLDGIFKRYMMSTSKSLGENARAAFWAGQYSAAKGMKDPIDSGMGMNANSYAEDYELLLKDEGASVINGKKVPWLKDSTTQQREDVAEIIRKGMAEGKPTGVKERVKGGYAKGTIAEDLDQYFEERRSHASTVARSEVGRIKNMGALQRYQERRVEEVVVLDNEGPNSCPECSTVNRTTWTVEYASEHELEHPNCVRAFKPIVRGFKR